MTNCRCSNPESDTYDIAADTCKMCGGRWLGDGQYQRFCRAIIALHAQEIFSNMQHEVMASGGSYPQPNDPRYRPYIGEYDGYQAPEQRYFEFAAERKELRKVVLKENGIEPHDT